MVRVRLKRKGKKFQPFYHFIAIDSKKRRNGQEIEKLGYYDPIKKLNKIDNSRIEYWVSKGAQISEGAQRALKQINAKS